MPAITTGRPAPEIDLKDMQGRPFKLQQARQTKPVVAAFFKVGCPTCQYAFPYFERIFKAYPADKVTFVGISQDPKGETEAFAKQYGVTFPILLEDTNKYIASNAYGLTNVPTTFVINAEGKVEFSSVGWAKSEIVELNKLAARAAGTKPADIFRPGEEIAEFKAG